MVVVEGEEEGGVVQEVEILDEEDVIIDDHELEVLLLVSCHLQIGLDS